MFKKLFKKKDNKLEAEIARTLEQMSKLDPLDESGKSQILSQYLETLYKAKEKENPKARVSPDTVVLVLAALGQTILILKHEELNVITTKAWSQLLKWRV